jgi:hypothetical protein
MPATAARLSGFLRFICVIALMMVAFAHQPVTVAASGTSLPAYTLPDGSVATLCIPGEDTSPKQAGRGMCVACCLVNAALLPPPPSIGGLAVFHPNEVKVFVREHRMAEALYPPSSGPRAPPVDPALA